MSIMVIRIAILLVIFLGGLFNIIAIAGREWRQLEVGAGLIKQTFGLWDGCIERKRVSKICLPIKLLILKSLISKVSFFVQSSLYYIYDIANLEDKFFEFIFCCFLQLNQILIF